MESINTRIIELSIKKRMKRMNLTALLLSGVCCYAIPSKHSRALMPAMVVLIKWAHAPYWRTIAFGLSLCKADKRR